MWIQKEKDWAHFRTESCVCVWGVQQGEGQMVNCMGLCALPLQWWMGIGSLCCSLQEAMVCTKPEVLQLRYLVGAVSEKSCAVCLREWVTAEEPVSNLCCAAMSSGDTASKPVWLSVCHGLTQRNYCKWALIAQNRAEEKHKSSAECVVSCSRCFSVVVFLLCFNLFCSACFLLLLSLAKVCELSCLLFFDPELDGD